MELRTQDSLTDAFLKQLKTGEELQAFLRDIHKRGLEKILEGELDAHLSYDKHEKTPSINARNGTQKKVIKPSLEKHLLRCLVTENLVLTPY
jgi:putative transposase